MATPDYLRQSKLQSPMEHRQLADQYLRRADEILAGLDERNDWFEEAETLLVLDAVIRLGHAHATRALAG